MKCSSTIGVALGLSVLCLAAFAPEAQAVVITNTTTGTTVFDSQGFENDVPGGAAAAANPGFWSNGAATQDTVITGGVPGAFEGNNYLSTTRGFIAAGNPRAFLGPAQTTPGDIIHAEWMMYITDPGLSDLGFFFANASGTNIGQMRIGGQGLSTLQDSWSGAITPNVYLPNVWQKWELDYTIGASDYNVTVNDGTPITGIVPGGAANSTGMDRLSFFHNGLQTYYIDSVPSAALDGDLNSDGFVGVDDLNIVLINWNQNVTPGDLGSGDATGEGFVGVDDLNIVLVNWNNGTPPAGDAVIPEPASLALLGLGGLTLLRNGRKRDR